MEFALEIVLLNTKPCYDVSVVVSICSKHLWKTWRRYGAYKPRTAITPTQIVSNPMKDDGGWYGVYGGVRVIRGQKFWGCERTLSYSAQSGLDPCLLNPPYTRITVRDAAIVIHEKFVPLIVIRLGSGRSAALRPRSSRRQRRKFLEIAQCVCGALGMTAKQMLAVALEITA